MARSFSKSSFRALISRGFDSATAEHLLNEGYTLKRLKSLAPEILLSLGIPEELVGNLLRDKRPPLPNAVVQKLLIESRFRCSLCHEPGKSLVIHHIEERSLSRDDSEDNLIVLCVEDHSEAHTTRTLGRNLSPALLRDAKEGWIKAGREQSAGLLLELSRTDGATWDYVNQRRLHSLLRVTGIDPRTSPYARSLTTSGLLDEVGLMQEISEWRVDPSPSRYLLDFGSGTTLYVHLEWLLQQLIQRLDVIDLLGK